MKTNNKIILATLISLTLGTTAIADTAGDTQVVTIDVPSVKLLDIKAAASTSTSADEADALSFTLVAPTVAGENFVDAADQTGYFDITSNIAAAGGTTRTITVVADALAAGWELDIDATAATAGTGADISFNNSNATTPQNLVTAIGNIAEKDNAITYTFGPEGTAVPAHTGGSTQNITLTYTLSDDA